MTDSQQRRAVVALWRHEIAAAVDLPEGVRIVALESRNNPLQIEVLIEGPDLEPVPDGCVAPYLQRPTDTETRYEPGAAGSDVGLAQMISDLIDEHDIRRVTVRGRPQRKIVTIELVERDGLESLKALGAEILVRRTHMGQAVDANR